jgi:hypothetical protein
MAESGPERRFGTVKCRIVKCRGPKIRILQERARKMRGAANGASRQTLCQGRVKTINWLVAPAPPGVKEPAAT